LNSQINPEDSASQIGSRTTSKSSTRQSRRSNRILHDCKSKGSCSNRRAESRSSRIQEMSVIRRAEVSSATRTRTLDTGNRNCQVRSQETSFSFNHGSHPSFVRTESFFFPHFISRFIFSTVQTIIIITNI